jgi:FkbM family methyltransferase
MNRTAARRAVKRLLARAGFEVHRRRGAGQRTLGQVLDHVVALGFEPASVIDVGVAHGTADLYDRFPSARLLLVEPLEEYRQVLETLSHERGAEYVLAAAGSEAGSQVLYVHRALACSSLLGERAGDQADVTPREVPVARLDELCVERGLRGPYALKVDVEGAELDVLAGASGILDETELLLLEVSLFRLNDRNPELAEVTGALRELGFVAYDIYDGHLRPIDGALAQVDMAFVREDGRFRRTHAYATPDQADRLYASWGF